MYVLYELLCSLQTSDYLHSESISCTAKPEYYYACEHCGEAAPNEEQYIYEGAIGEHDFSAGYQANGTLHWLACSKCDYAHYQNHTLDANNYCATCDTTVYNVWLGDIQITSKNCDDITGDGSAFYIPEQNRLFLTNYTDDRNNRKGITVIDPDNGDDYVAMIYAKNGLNLYIRGENFLYEDEGDIGRQYAVYVESGDLKIDGTGSLYTNASTGFYTVDGDIYIDKSGGLLEVVARYAFRCAEHKFYISNGTVKARSYAGYVYTSAPVLDNYSCYYAEISDNYNMNNSKPFEPITNIKYFYIEPAYMVTIEPFECEGDYITEVLRYGAEYTLPACPYTAPAGKTFYKWGVTPPGNLYEAGVQITITEDVELMPLWQAITPTTPTATYSGTVTSFGSDTDDVTVELYAEGSASADYTVTVKGNTAEYSIEGVAAGTYTMKVMKNNHVTREYTVTVGAENVTQDVKIHLLGDINGDGKISAVDKKLIYSHIDSSKELTGYEFDVANVNGDTKISAVDKKMIYNHISGDSSLWE